MYMNKLIDSFPCFKKQVVVTTCFSLLTREIANEVLTHTQQQSL